MKSYKIKIFSKLFLFQARRQTHLWIGGGPSVVLGTLDIIP